MRLFENLVLLVCALCKCGMVDAQCNSVGYNSYTSRVGDGSSSPSGGQYLMVSNRFEVDCCGFVSSWSISAHNTGTLSLQIWRPEGGATYRLIGENVVNVAATGDNTFNIGGSDSINVQAGDQVGWYTSGAPIVDWVNNNGNNGNFNYLTASAAATAVGSTATFSSGNNEEYAVYATISTSGNPTFSNLPSSVTFKRNSLSMGTTVFTALATTTSNDTLTYSLQSASPSGSFALDSSTGSVSPTSSSTSPNTYTLTIRTTDSCGNNENQDLTITVTNTPPELHGLPLVVDISESAVDETLLHKINVTDADEDSVTCTVSSSPSGPFIEKYSNDVATGEVLTGVYLQAHSNLDYDTTTSYTITVSCTDTLDTDVGTIYVYVVKNNVPVISNLQNSTSITSVTPSNTAIFQVLFTDAEKDAVSFSLACTPASPCPFSIYSTGQIFLSQSILKTSINAYEVDVAVSDAFTSSGTHRLTVFVTDLNTAPQLANLPATIQVTEDTAIGTTLYTVSVYDEDGDTGHTFSPTFSPAAGAGLFSLDNDSGNLTLSSKLNFFTQATSYNMSVEASDGQAISQTSWLVLEIVNVNEAPVLYQTNYQVQTEEALAGSTFPNVRFNVYDPDGDNLTYAFAPQSDTYGFSIASSTGEISLTLDYDREDTGLGNSSRVWLVSISDPSGFSVTATLTVSILDKEDNVPQLDSTSYTGSVPSDATVGQVVTTASATDADATAENRVLEYSISGSSVFNVDGSGNIVVFTGLAGLEKTQHTFTLTVKNPGSASTDTATVSIYVTEASSESFLDKPGNIALVTISCVAGVGVLGGLAYLAINAYSTASSAPPTYRLTQVAPKDTQLAEPNKPGRSTRLPEINRGNWSPWDNQWF